VDQLPDDRYASRGGRFSEIPDFWERMIRLRKGMLRFLSRWRHQDVPLQAFLERGGLRTEDRELLYDFVEGYHAALVERVSTRWVAGDPDEDNESGDHQFRLVRGNDQLIHWLRGGLDPRRVEIRLNTAASAIEWSPHNVTVRCRTGLGVEVGPFRARSAVVTLPVAVLRSGTVRFRPPIPEKERALEFLETGSVFKIVLRFRESFWDEPAFVRERFRRKGARQIPDINFLLAHDASVPTWWTALPAHIPTFTGWAGGKRAQAMLAADGPRRLDRTLDALATALAVGRKKLDDQLEAHMLHDWVSDAYSRGAYSYVGVGGSAAPKSLAKPVKGTLFFAGEATDAEQTGTVAGAIASGRRAAKQLVRAIKA
jgi:monoamine oxidase